MARLKKGPDGWRGIQVVRCACCGFTRSANGTPAGWIVLRTGKAVCCSGAIAKRVPKADDRVAA